MSNVLLYGATGFSGGLIAAVGKARGMTKWGNDFRMTLAARDGAKLRSIADKNDMDFRVFSLDNLNEVRKQLVGFKVVINAAGPFAFTAKALANAALGVPCHYVDINSEFDVYRTIDDFGPKAEQRGIAMVSGAGSSAAASDVLLDKALSKLLADGKVKADEPLRAVRIAVSQSKDITSGGAATIARSLREQVAVIRYDPNAKREKQIQISHEPVGKLERAFDFGLRPGDPEPVTSTERGKSKKAPLRIASAVNMVDTLTAKHTLVRNGLRADTIESYMEMGSLSRIAYQVGGALSPFTSLPWVRALTAAQPQLLPDCLSQSEQDQDPSVVVIEIEDRFRTLLVDWRWKTPNVNQFTAQLVVGTARNVASCGATGWVTPAQALRPIELNSEFEVKGDEFQGCELEERQSVHLLKP